MHKFPSQNKPNGFKSSTLETQNPSTRHSWGRRTLSSSPGYVWDSPVDVQVVLPRAGSHTPHTLAGTRHYYSAWNRRSSCHLRQHGWRQRCWWVTSPHKWKICKSPIRGWVMWLGWRWEFGGILINRHKISGRKSGSVTIYCSFWWSSLIMSPIVEKPWE